MNYFMYNGSLYASTTMPKVFDQILTEEQYQEEYNKIIEKDKQQELEALKARVAELESEAAASEDTE